MAPQRQRDTTTTVKPARGFIDGKTAAIVYLVAEFIIFALTVIATPIAQFKPKDSSSMCITMWGYKVKCSSTQYNAKGIAAFGCGQRKNNMTAAAVFSIASIVVLLLAVIWGLLLLLRMMRSYLIPGVLTLLATAFLLICWACIAGVYSIRMCKDGDGSKHSYKDGNLKYGAGFIMLVLAWVLQVLTCVFVFILMFWR